MVVTLVNPRLEAMWWTAPCMTSTCLEWYSVNILSGECDITTWSSVTGTCSQSDNLSAFSCLNVFPAFVTKMEGTRHRSSFLLYSREKASGAEGRIFLPLTITPSMSNMMPKFGLERGEGDAVDDEELRRRDFAEDKRPCNVIFI